MTNRLVTFDGDGTLWDFRKTMTRALTETLNELRQMLPGEASDALTVERLIEIRDEVAKRMQLEPGVRTTAWLERVRAESFAEILRYLNHPDSEMAARLTEIYFSHRWGRLEVYADVVPGLDALKGKYGLGVITNGNSKLEQAGLSEYFDFMIRADELGVEKPNRLLFDAACRHGGCNTTDLVHVGDSLEHDVAGAKAVGAWAVWLNRDGPANATDIEPDEEIDAVTKLREVLEA